MPSRLILITVLLSFCSGCASSSLLGSSADAPRWWKLSFSVAWANNMPEPISCAQAEVCWELDYLLAHQVLRQQILDDLQGEVWRFHRRAANDTAGHLFSVLFFVDQDKADKFQRKISTSLMVQQLQALGVIKAIRMRGLSTSGGDEQAFSASSDPIWDVRLQRSWPWFIMGVSQTWLALIDEVVAQDIMPLESDLQQQLAYYQGVRAEVLALWQQQGAHAYLHHLNAIYDYQPLTHQGAALRF